MATYYVTQDGAGARNGLSLATAFSRADHNAATFAAGDLIYLCGTITQVIVAPSSGSAGDPITYRSDFADAPGDINAGGVAAHGFSSGGRDHLFVYGIAIRNTTGDGVVWGTNAQISTGVVFDSLTVEDCGAEGIQTGAGGANDGGITSVQVINCTVRRCAGNGILTFNSTGALILHNLVEDCGTAGANNHDGIAINDNCGGAVVGDNRVLRQKSDSGSGIDIQDAEASARIYVLQNHVEGSTAENYKFAATTPVTAIGNVSVGGTSGLVCYNTAGNFWLYNTIYRCSNQAIRVGITTSDGELTARGNLLENVGGVSVLVIDRVGTTLTLCNHNRFDEGATFRHKDSGLITAATWQETFDGDSILGGDALLDPDSGDFSLTASSPARAAGTWIAGARALDDLPLPLHPDIGAWQDRGDLSRLTGAGAG